MLPDVPRTGPICLPPLDLDTEFEPPFAAVFAWLWVDRLHWSRSFFRDWSSSASDRFHGSPPGMLLFAMLLSKLGN